MTVRMKLVVNTVSDHGDQGAGEGVVTAQEITLSAVYSDKEGSANKTWAKWTPTGQLKFTVTNPEVFGQFKPGMFFFADLVPTTKDAM